MKPYEILFRSYAENHPVGAARALEALDHEAAAKALSKLPAKQIGLVVDRMVPQAAGAIIAHLSPKRTKELLLELSPRHAASVLQHLDAPVQQTVLADTDPELVERLRRLASYAPNTAGAMMDPQVVSVASDVTVEQAIRMLRKSKGKRFYHLYLTDRDGRFLGRVALRDLVTSPPRTRIETLLQQDVPRLFPGMDRLEVAQLIEQRKLATLPVVDEDGRLLGAVRHEDAIAAVKEEAFEEMQRMVGAGSEEKALSPVSTVIKRRLPWLYVNLLTAFLAASVVGLFEGIIAQVTALAVLLPVVAGQAGNTGSQSLAVVMRGIALREIVPGARKRLVIKELVSGAINGGAIGIVTGLVVLAWSKSWALALVIAVGMVITMAAAGLAGAIIPLALKAMGRDPAQSSSIFLTTVTDVVGFASFLGLAVVMSSYLK